MPHSMLNDVHRMIAFNFMMHLPFKSTNREPKLAIRIGEERTNPFKIESRLRGEPLLNHPPFDVGKHPFCLWK